MIDAGLFDKLVGVHPFTISVCALTVYYQELVARGVRENDRPFGGIQVSHTDLKLGASDLQAESLYFLGTFSNFHRLTLCPTMSNLLSRRIRGTYASISLSP